MDNKNGIELEKEKACKRALFLLEYRDYSRKELLKKLKEKYDDEISEYAVSKMESMGFVDDCKYARKLLTFFVEKKLLHGRRLKYEMIKKGIEKQLVEELVAEIDDDPVDVIREIIESKYAGYQNDEKKKRRAVAALQRLGYEWEDIKTAIQEES